MKINMLLLIGGIVATATWTTASADTPRYDFADVLYQGINDPSGSGLSSDHVIGLDGSYAFTDKFVGLASYGHESVDFNSGGFNGTDSINTFSVGVGYRIPLNDSVDLFPNLSYLSEHGSASAPGFSNSVTDTGYDAGLMLRAMVTPQVELQASADHSSPGSATNSVGVAALYNFTPAFAVGIGYASAKSNGQSTSAWTVALRYYFK